MVRLQLNWCCTVHIHTHSRLINQNGDMRRTICLQHGVSFCPSFSRFSLPCHLQKSFISSTSASIFHQHKSQPLTCQTHQGIMQWKSCRHVYNSAKTSFSHQHSVHEHKLQRYEYKRVLWLSVISLSAYSKQRIAKRCCSYYLAASSPPHKAGERLGMTKLSNWEEPQREQERGFFMANHKKKLELIYVLQVDMRLIAMVTGHVPHHLPSARPPTLPPPSPPTAITHLWKMTLVHSLCHRCCLRISPLGCWILTRWQTPLKPPHHNIQRTRHTL